MVERRAHTFALRREEEGILVNLSMASTTAHNDIQGFDVRVVEWAAKCSVDPTFALGDSQEPILAVLDNPQPLNIAVRPGLPDPYEETASTIRSHLARGRPVVIRHSGLEEDWAWDEQSAQKITGTLNTPVVWQGPSHPHAFTRYAVNSSFTD